MTAAHVWSFVVRNGPSKVDLLRADGLNNVINGDIVVKQAHGFRIWSSWRIADDLVACRVARSLGIGFAARRIGGAFVKPGA